MSDCLPYVGHAGRVSEVMTYALGELLNVEYCINFFFPRNGDFKGPLSLDDDSLFKAFLVHEPQLFFSSSGCAFGSKIQAAFSVK
jgi:hypothetical protein